MVRGSLKIFHGKNSHLNVIKPRYYCKFERFAGKNHPTIALFRTGSYQIMGGKSLSLGYRSEVFVKRLIDRFEKKCANGHHISEKV